MCLPLCDDDALCASWRLKRHQRRFDTARKRRWVTEIERGCRWVWGGACQRHFALCCAVGWDGGREGHSDKLSSHFVFTQLAFVCKMPVALFSASRNTLFDPVVAGACTNLWSSQTVERLIYHYTTRKLPHHVETYLELVIRKGSWLSKSFSQVLQTFNCASNARFPILASRCYFRIFGVVFMVEKVMLPITVPPVFYFQAPPTPKGRQARPACKMS